MQISSEDLRAIYAHATRTYPYECFGFLVGSHDQAGCVVQVVPGTNARAKRPDRFEMDAAEFLAVEAAAERDGLEVIGFYHSHPDWPAVPSTEDLRLAWSGSYYLIVAVHSAHPTCVSVWRLVDDKLRYFTHAPLDVIEAATGDHSAAVGHVGICSDRHPGE
jgi:proteasome lid subunit RPN8/RPN11